MKHFRTFNQFFFQLEKERNARIRNAGKHKCIWKLIGGVRRLTKLKGKQFLKRPVYLQKSYECKICAKIKHMNLDIRTEK